MFGGNSYTQCLLFIVAICLFRASNGTDCYLSINRDLMNPQPLFLTLTGGYGNDAFWSPTNMSGLYFKTGEELEIACPGSEILISYVSQNTSILLASCIEDKVFQFGNIVANEPQVVCSKHPTKAAVYTGNTCMNEYKEIKIGFDLADGRFLTTMYVCFDDVKQNSLYSVFNLTSKIDAYQANYERTGFIESGFYHLGSLTLDALYSRKKQRESINKLLGLSSTSTKYIHSSNDYYLARGHLTAKTDFLYGSQQRLTFYFVNAAPQWQTLNAGNWLSLENSVRNFAVDRSLDLTVYTGTHGILTLPHEETGEETELYFYVEDSEKYSIPIPELFWKIVYNVNSKSGIAFVAINNPYKNHYEPLCNSVCDQINWVKWNNDNQKSGFAYCCTVDEFRQIVPALPEFDVNNLLI